MQPIRIMEIPPCKMVSSGTGMFGQDPLEAFGHWFTHLPPTLYPQDFLYFDGTGFCWLYMYNPQLNVPDAFQLVDFPGGPYAVATDIDQQTDMDAMTRAVDAFLAENGLKRDTSRFDLGNIITSPAAQKILGYSQMNYYAPVKARESVQER